MFSPSGLPSHARLQATRLVIGTWFGSLLWPLLTSAPGASLRHSRAPPSQQPKSRSPQVRTHPFGQSRPHLLHRDCCLRALACCAALPSLHSLLCDSCSSVPTFAVPLTSDPQSPAAPLRLANWLRQLASRGLSPPSFQAPFQIWNVYLKGDTDVPILGTHNAWSHMAD